MPQPAFKAPFGTTAAMLSIALILWLLSNVDYTKEGLPLIIAAIAGLLVFAVFSMFRRKSDENNEKKYVEPVPNDFT